LVFPYLSVPRPIGEIVLIMNNPMKFADTKCNDYLVKSNKCKGRYKTGINNSEIEKSSQIQISGR
jgi:hypothetical protein